MKPKIRGQLLTLEQKGLNGGRRGVKGEGYVKMEFFIDKESGDVCISTFDNLNTDDGHYAPLNLIREDANTLLRWLNLELS